MIPFKVGTWLDSITGNPRPSYVSDWFEVLSSVRVDGPIPISFDLFKKGRRWVLKVKARVKTVEENADGEVFFDYDLGKRPSKEKILQEVRALVHRVYLHEADEQIQVFAGGGYKQPFNPHTEPKNVDVRYKYADGDITMEQ